MHIRAALLCFAVLGAACQPSIDSGDGTDPGTSELDYYSTDAIEYYFDGDATLQIEDDFAAASDEAKLARAQAVMGIRTTSIAWFLNIRLAPRTLWATSDGDANRDSYPGFGGIVRIGDAALTGLRPTGDGKTYTYHLKLQAAGPMDMLDKLPGKKLAGGKKAMPLQMAKLSNDQMLGVNKNPAFATGTFDPTKMSASELETITLTVYPEPRSSDAYLDYGKLFSDGKLTLDAHYGYDYLEGYDVSNSHALYTRLMNDGFTSPSSSYETYEGKLGPLTREVEMGGKRVKIEVRIFRGASPSGLPGPNLHTNEGGRQMENDMRDSLAHSDVIVFSGHSGQYHGFALSDWNDTQAGQFEYPQIMSAEMPRDQYQIILASGCETYSIAQAFSQNPSKPGLANLNIITTVGWSQAGWNKDVDALLDALYGASFNPPTISGMLTKLNRTSALNDLYGLHGIDGDPKLHPFARVDLLGTSCRADADCGGPGNRCSKSGAKSVCSASCVNDSACPAPYRCKAVADGVQKQCL